MIDVGAKTYTIEVTGDEKKINAILALLKPLGIKELVRTGRVAMIRGSKISTEPILMHPIPLSQTGELVIRTSEANRMTWLEKKKR